MHGEDVHVAVAVSLALSIYIGHFQSTEAHDPSSYIFGRVLNKGCVRRRIDSDL
jgi:hypothetical protein